MNNKLFILGLSLSSFLIAGLSKSKPSYLHYKPIDTLCAKIEKKCEENLQLKAFGKGGSMVNNVKSVNYTFASYEHLDVVTARSLAIRCANLFLSEINADIDVRPHLDTFPFTTHNIVLQINSYDTKTKKHFDPPSIALVVVEKGQIKYYTNPNPRYPFKLVKKETFEEACILDQQDNQ